MYYVCIINVFLSTLFPAQCMPIYPVSGGNINPKIQCGKTNVRKSKLKLF